MILGTRVVELDRVQLCWGPQGQAKVKVPFPLHSLQSDCQITSVAAFLEPMDICSHGLQDRVLQDEGKAIINGENVCALAGSARNHPNSFT